MEDDDSCRQRQQEDNDPAAYIEAAARAVERLKKNILRYITIL